MPKILIADDSIAVRKVAERLLTEAGMGVTLAANGSEALALLSKDRPDLIVSDVIMPDKSGYEVCAFIRAQANLADIPVLLISGIVNDEVSRQADSCKADGVLKKPFQGTSLKDRVLDLLMKRQSKPLPVPEPLPDRVRQEPPFVEEASARMPQIIDAPEHVIEQTPRHAEPDESDRMSVSRQDEKPLVESHAAFKSDMPQMAAQPTLSTEAADHQAELLAQREGKIKELEGQLACERRQSHEQVQQLQNSLEEQRAQVAGLDSRNGELNQALVEERARRAALTEQLDEVSVQARRVEGLETELVEVRRRMEELSHVVSDNARNESRIVELEAHLAAERGAAAQLVQQITTLEHIERRAHELETTLASEREQAEVCRRQSAGFEAIAGRVPNLEHSLVEERARIVELESILATEREAAAVVMAQAKQLEPAVQRAHDLDLALAEERERSSQLTQRATEAEHLAEQSNRRFEDMARKLGEIAGLASQLGNAKR
jgi:CheY-like chemotaxis protein